MAIRGLTDRDSITPRFPRIGKLRKGGEKTVSGFGADLDHWRFTSRWPGAEAAFLTAYGEAPRQINVYLPYATAEECFQSWKEAWKACGLDHRCDGEICTIWLGPDGKYHREPKPCPGGCKEIGRLEIMIPELVDAGFVGIVTMETHSKNDLISITETLMKTAELRGDNPLGLRNIRFNLRRVPEKISVPGFGMNAGQRQRVEKWLVKIEPAVDWVQAQMAVMRMPALVVEDLKGIGEDERPEETEDLDANGDSVGTNGDPVGTNGETRSEPMEIRSEPMAVKEVVSVAESEPGQSGESGEKSPQQDLWDLEAEAAKMAEAGKYPLRSWSEFRDFAVKTLSRYANGKQVAEAVNFGGIYQPWLHWSPETAARCWLCLTERVDV